MTFLPEAGLGGGGEGGIVSSDQAGDPLWGIFREVSGVLGAGPTCVNWVCACSPRMHTPRRRGGWLWGQQVEWRLLSNRNLIYTLVSPE